MTQDQQTPGPRDRSTPVHRPLDVLVVGGHGQVALLLERRLAAAGHRVRGTVRSEDHVADLREAGAEAVMIDLEACSVEDLAAAVRGSDAVVFAAGGGPDGNRERKETVDKGAAIMLADAAEAAGVRRYVMVSAMGTADADPDSDEVFQVYLRAKAAADADLVARDLDWTIVRPGRLTDDAATGQVAVGADVGYGEVPRDDVAAVLAAVLDDPRTHGRVVELVAGSTPVADVGAEVAAHGAGAEVVLQG